MKKKALIFIAIMLIAGIILFLYHRRHHSNWMEDHYVMKEIMIPMRDGIKLYTIVYIPKDEKEEHPILINRTPYSAKRNGENSIKDYSYWNHLYDCYFKENYIIVKQDVRGRYKSEGSFVNVRPYIHNKTEKEIDEASDAYDTIDWLVKNITNNNGRVGVIGISYPGFYAAMAGLSGHPALKAISPQAPVVNWFIGDDWHHNGALMELHAFNFYSTFGNHTKHPGKILNTYEEALQIGPLKNLAKFMGDSVVFWNEMYVHQDYDSFWVERNCSNNMRYIPSNIATLVVGGLFDAENLYGALDLYDSIAKYTGKNARLVMGPWMHGGWVFNKGDHLGNVSFSGNTSEWYQKNIELPFFNYYLKNSGNIDNIKKATIFFTGDNKWKSFDSWPSTEKLSKQLFLHSDGSLTFFENNQIKPNYNKFLSDPSKPVPYTDDTSKDASIDFMTGNQFFASKRADVIVFKTDTLEQDITLAGPVIADIYMSISSTDADLVVKLIDVFPDNFSYDTMDKKITGKNYSMASYEMLVRGDIMRGRYRNSFVKPQPFIPNQISEVKYTLSDVAHVFKKGHRIMVQIQSSWFPLVDRNPQQFIDIYNCTQKEYISNEIKIYSGANKSSTITLPIINYKI